VKRTDEIMRKPETLRQEPAVEANYKAGPFRAVELLSDFNHRITGGY